MDENRKKYSGYHKGEWRQQVKELGSLMGVFLFLALLVGGVAVFLDATSRGGFAISRDALIDFELTSEEDLITDDAPLRFGIVASTGRTEAHLILLDDTEGNR